MKIGNIQIRNIHIKHMNVERMNVENMHVKKIHARNTYMEGRKLENMNVTNITMKGTECSMLRNQYVFLSCHEYIIFAGKRFFSLQNDKIKKKEINTPLPV
ncbi:hypothetical protein AK88_02722 [Plasmodium fragile]|uniref:Uncharacterized protein n=1 Tax=Plasmodium fragile TaxID=5857 RepID=A0A0D9QPB7_PLAFR|nr:uncharacterized protein AK88_02722 [Plasmodium fragile]KJP87556.1 hypothetical protein AK88_02722 [Plasmodium fragile]